MQSTNSEYGTTYMASHHFHFFLLTTEKTGGDHKEQKINLYLQHSGSKKNAGTGDGLGLKSHKHIGAKAVIHVVPGIQELNHNIAIRPSGLIFICNLHLMYKASHIMQKDQTNTWRLEFNFALFLSVSHVPLSFYTRVKRACDVDRHTYSAHLCT